MITLIAIIVAIVGALNWLFVGIFDWSLITWICGGFNVGARILYAIIGIAGLWLIYFVAKRRGRIDQEAV